MPDESGSQEISRQPQGQAPLHLPLQPPRNDKPPSTPAVDNHIDYQSTAARLEQIKPGERWLIGVGIAGVLINILICWFYLQQLTQMKLATQASTRAVELANQTLEYNNGNFDRAMQRTIDQTISQNEATKASTKSAKAAKSAAETAAKQLDLEERPWISADFSVVGPLIFDQDGAHVDVKVIIKNAGHSPAIHGQYEPKMFPTFLLTPNPVEERGTACANAIGRAALEQASDYSTAWFPGDTPSATIRFTIGNTQIHDALDPSHGRAGN